VESLLVEEGIENSVAYRLEVGKGDHQVVGKVVRQEEEEHRQGTVAWAYLVRLEL